MRRTGLGIVLAVGFSLAPLAVESKQRGNVQIPLADAFHEGLQDLGYSPARRQSVLLLLALGTPALAFADEISIGRPKMLHGMKLAPVYLQAVPTDPEGGSWGPPPDKSDIHLEVDVTAVRGNRHGFKAGSFVPALTIHYTLIHLATGTSEEGELWAMVAKDGPHYGINVKMRGSGRYRLTLLVQPPDRTGFGRHTDRETGVPAWWEPFEVNWEFAYPASRATR